MLVPLLPVTLILAGGLALINLWLSIRAGQARQSSKVWIGDGGDEALIRRMRAHANFVENAPFVLILVGVIEASVGTNIWLWVAAAAFLVARIAHPFGMDGWKPGRAIGAGISMLLLPLLGVWAIAIPFTAHHEVHADPIETVVPQG